MGGRLQEGRHGLACDVCLTSGRLESWAEPETVTGVGAGSGQLASKNNRR